MGDYATTTDTETILAKRHQGVGNDVAALKGARLVATAEIEQDRRLAESKVKNLTGSDTVTARFLYGEPFNFKPEFKLWLSTNNKPTIRDTDDGIWDRIKLIPFTRRFESANADPKLLEKLPGVLAWMVEGCLEWQRSGLGDPEKVRAATEGYRAEMDVIAAFVDECCTVHPDAWCKFSDLYAAYIGWCEESNEHPEKKRRFADALTERGFAKLREGHRGAERQDSEGHRPAPRR
jgi:putative DNA primase/helicase